MLAYFRAVTLNCGARVELGRSCFDNGVPGPTNYGCHCWRLAACLPAVQAARVETQPCACGRPSAAYDFCTCSAVLLVHAACYTRGLAVTVLASPATPGVNFPRLRATGVSACGWPVALARPLGKGVPVPRPTPPCGPSARRTVKHVADIRSLEQGPDGWRPCSTSGHLGKGRWCLAPCLRTTLQQGVREAM